MSHNKPASNKQHQKTKSILVIPSKSNPFNVDHPEGAEETEITAEVSVPPEGGWGWVVVFGSFACTFILDGVFFTFGSIFKDMTDDLGIDGTLVALINSITVALYLICGPLVSALVNRFGFRACTMSGSIILSSAFLCSYYATSYSALVFFYGVVSGFGGCLVLVPSAVVVGFYFERLRAIALAISGLGSSMGIMIMFSVNSYLVNIAGWRIVTLLHSGLFGTLYFIGMVYRPLVVLTLTQTTDTDDPTRTVTYLPSLNQTRVLSKSKIKEGLGPTAAERLFSAVSNRNFPTAASVVQEGVNMKSVNKAGTSTQAISKLTISVRNVAGSASQKQVQAMVSRMYSVTNKDKIHIEIAEEAEQVPPTKWWAKCFCCIWEKHVNESRPMYRDDAFYTGHIEELPVYQKSVAAVNPEERTGLEYQMAVSRVVSIADLEEHNGLCTTAVRRVLATMMDPQLLKRCSFLLLCCSAVLIFMGLLTPYVFLPDRAKSEGIDEKHCLRSLVLVDCYGLEKLTNATGMMLMSQGFGSLLGSPMVGILKQTFGYSVSFYAAGTVLILSGLVLLPVNKIVKKENENLEVKN
ncbi:unnamed protein product [Arctia plantaginis]|uniref:Uncharacterized protein n=1 Tax=Arctia plantaginis TaxID=874455 RepID=A0A8S0YNR0_ARCPL|nr:unnamed protein product [Arctia plantaginis]CAB3238038.1 unnamed protein product [Arctia plantaginis]